MLQTIARAKLNLALHVTGQRPDGYHLLSSLVGFANFGDDISVEASTADSLTVDGRFAEGTPDLVDNSLGQALVLVRAWRGADLAESPLSIKLTKNLPIASGIGGGSADAAALIALLTKGRALNAQEWDSCLALGADVPMCLRAQAAIIGGIGEESTPVRLPVAHLVLVNPGVEVSTPAIFKALTQKDNPPLAPWTKPESFSDLIAYLAETRNDLMGPAMAQTDKIVACLDALGAAPFARMSGSGATCFALLETAEQADALASEIVAHHPDWWVQAGRLAEI